jgi:serine protease inhibitor
MANKIFVKDEMPIKAEFTSAIQNFFHATVSKVNFSATETLDILKKWLTENTDDKLNNFISQGILSVHKAWDLKLRL